MSEYEIGKDIAEFKQQTREEFEKIYGILIEQGIIKLPKEQNEKTASRTAV